MAPTASHTNGTSRQVNAIDGGIYVPVITPFTDDEELDLRTFESHLVRLGKAGVHFVIMGTNGEEAPLP
ncbi:hypothetical protein IE53DRAFT_367463 [Violaceomyces palustris]|uniref:Uncharacterized protein n=1 Tax=Violaceomyces palustris TaxID=1673888 RepID=A0ACD0P227_9BASI|nr:hypothetical protein IE53DRAFT_367463 [Violaceomyces palustris]